MADPREKPEVKSAKQEAGSDASASKAQTANWTEAFAAGLIQGACVGAAGPALARASMSFKLPHLEVIASSIVEGGITGIAAAGAVEGAKAAGKLGEVAEKTAKSAQSDIKDIAMGAILGATAGASLGSTLGKAGFETGKALESNSKKSEVHILHKDDRKSKSVDHTNH